MTIMTRGGAKTWWGKDLPQGVAYMYHDGGYCGLGTTHQWKSVTYKELLDKKIENQNCELSRKRASNKIVPCYIWVFYNNTDLFGGWWIYIVTLKKEYGINFRHEYSSSLIKKAMSLFPCGILPLQEYFDGWAEKFAKTFRNTTFYHGRKQGLKMCYCEIDEYGKLINLLSK